MLCFSHFADAVQQHKRFYNNEDDEPATSQGMGSAAAMQALKMFSGGSTGNSEVCSFRRRSYLMK
jgi:hypothetical protein